MPPEQLQQSIQRLLREQVQCVLGTQGGDYPGMHLMAYAFSPDLTTLWLASPEKTRKVTNMRARPAVSLLWDNRSGNSSDHIDGFALSGLGEAEELRGQSAGTAIEALLARNDSLTNLLADEDTAIFAIHISRYRFVVGYTEVYELQPATVPVS